MNDSGRRLGIRMPVMAAAGMLLLSIGGCSSTYSTRAYPLGAHPQTTQKLIESIVLEEVVNHRNENRPSRRSGTGEVVISPILDEGTVVVSTWREGHRKIEAALAHMKQYSPEPQSNGQVSNPTTR